MARMSQLRERHKSLTKHLSDIKYVEEKIQVRNNIECMENASVKITKNIAIYFHLFHYIEITEKVSKIFTNAF